MFPSTAQHDNKNKVKAKLLLHYLRQMNAYQRIIFVYSMVVNTSAVSVFSVWFEGDFHAILEIENFILPLYVMIGWTVGANFIVFVLGLIMFDFSLCANVPISLTWTVHLQQPRKKFNDWTQLQNNFTVQ